MKDSSTEVSRDSLSEEYNQWCLQLRSEAKPCQDDALLPRVRTLLREHAAGLDRIFTVLPFHRMLTEVAEEPNCTRHLSAFIKATELLEMLCINLFLQPWRREFKILKCFTGAFVYYLKPVFSTATLQLVLALIGYMPDPESPNSQYRLSSDVNPDKTIQVGFELMLARTECLHHMELLENNKLSAEEFLERLQRKTLRQREDKSENQIEDIGEDKAETRTGYRRPQPVMSEHGYHFSGVDHSIIEMQKNYPDLAIMGRPILPEKPKLPQPYLTRKDEALGSTAASGSSSNSDDRSRTDVHDKKMGRAHWELSGSRTEAAHNRQTDVGMDRRGYEGQTQEDREEEEESEEGEDNREEEDQELLNGHYYVLL